MNLRRTLGKRVRAIRKLLGAEMNTAQFPRDSRAQFPTDPRAQFPRDPRAQFPTDPRDIKRGLRNHQPRSQLKNLPTSRW